ncbi:MAG: hypothetical protein K2F78_06090, partial [Muribaculaceae bacterium]|nr:hypothetical protein [Muribaculaceae bacterium]
MSSYADRRSSRVRTGAIRRGDDKDVIAPGSEVANWWNIGATTSMSSYADRRSGRVRPSAIWRGDDKDVIAPV